MNGRTTFQPLATAPEKLILGFLLESTRREVKREKSGKSMIKTQQVGQIM